MTAGFQELTAREATLAIIRRRGGQWYRCATGRPILARDCGPTVGPETARMSWPDPVPADFLLDTDSFPDYGRDVNAMIALALELRERYGDPYRLLLETDPQGRRRWLAMFRKSLAEAWADTPAEAMARAYLGALAYHEAPSPA